MKIAVQKNHLVGQIWYRSLDPVKKRRQRCYAPRSRFVQCFWQKYVVQQNKGTFWIQILFWKKSLTTVHCIVDEQFRFLSKKSIFVKKIDFWRKIPILDKKCGVLTKIFCFWKQFLIVWRKFPFWRKIPIFAQTFRFLPKNFDFWWTI